MTNNKIFKIVQITDTHLFADDNATLFDSVNSNKTFDAVIERVKKEDLADTDMIFLTGDVSQDESDGSYQRIADRLQALNLPICWIPGNHDDFAKMERIFAEASWFMNPFRLSVPCWEFLFLNTQKENDTTGTGILAATELKKLKAKLKELALQDNPIAIVMHHPPIQVQTPLMDKTMLQNHEEFWQIITDAKVKLIITGHVHNDYQLKHNDVDIETSPATCVQFVKGATSLQFETKIGYKVYFFEGDQYFAKSKIWSLV